ncbi:DUF6232 family protein [Spongiactinospora sp. TRM90649]|uniref:DUF6232 family protein n=1 Tax=Spongiactinospora sp. TRM90649 TaxID=3031114 RepID=UPI0023F6412A|nr:DUF6232 family protein [Spongiactinospora sp. TRM90649]MDF5756047.1 DUF6232 family protein [Spongiactinospora sp. TRM90649]
MAKEHVGEIRISKRVVRIAHEVYPLANISRVQTLKLVWGGKYATYYPLREIAALIVLVGVAVVALDVVLPELDVDIGYDIEGAVRQFMPYALGLAGIRAAYLLVVLFYRIVIRRPRYALVIEAAGTQYTALSGSDHREIHRIKGEIVSAIEDPPSEERTIHVSGDLVVGDKVGRDKYHQDGTGNRMTFNS